MSSINVVNLFVSFFATIALFKGVQDVPEREIYLFALGIGAYLGGVVTNVHEKTLVKVLSAIEDENTRDQVFSKLLIYSTLIFSVVAFLCFVLCYFLYDFFNFAHSGSIDGSRLAFAITSASIFFILINQFFSCACLAFSKLFLFELPLVLSRLVLIYIYLFWYETPDDLLKLAVAAFVVQLFPAIIYLLCLSGFIRRGSSKNVPIIIKDYFKEMKEVSLYSSILKSDRIWYRYLAILCPPGTLSLIELINKFITAAGSVYNRGFIVLPARELYKLKGQVGFFLSESKKQFRFMGWIMIPLALFLIGFYFYAPETYFGWLNSEFNIDSKLLVIFILVSLPGISFQLYGQWVATEFYALNATRSYLNISLFFAIGLIFAKYLGTYFYSSYGLVAVSSLYFIVYTGYLLHLITKKYGQQG